MRFGVLLHDIDHGIIGLFARPLTLEFQRDQRPSHRYRASLYHVCLPPYGPELNPMARIWRDLKDALTWRSLPTLAVQHDDLAPLLRGSEAASLQALTGYTYLLETLHALCA
jgi:hypothetical protein